jgi:exopolysaccharide biosynthesis polyprenyl glycosylphosphotransferase
MQAYSKAKNIFHEDETFKEQAIDFNSPRSIYLYFKRFFDIVISLIGVIVSFPCLVLFGMLIKLESKGQVFYFQERVGHNGKIFNIIKLRSMRTDAEVSGAVWAQKNDPRVTRVGKFIRMTRIDELPQFINVLLGDMSIVGPRPERPVFTSQFNKEVPGFIDRLQVKPGITGWAQVNGGYEVSPEEKLTLDKYYIGKMSFLLDFKILIMTIKVCITSDGAR